MIALLRALNHSEVATTFCLIFSLHKVSMKLKVAPQPPCQFAEHLRQPGEGGTLHGDRRAHLPRGPPRLQPDRLPEGAAVREIPAGGRKPGKGSQSRECVRMSLY